MRIENIIKALEQQRSVALTQNVELMARVMELEEELARLQAQDVEPDAADKD